MKIYWTKDKLCHILLVSSDAKLLFSQGSEYLHLVKKQTQLCKTQEIMIMALWKIRHMYDIKEFKIFRSFAVYHSMWQWIK
jgi:hypothetical protein